MKEGTVIRFYAITAMIVCSILISTGVGIYAVYDSANGQKQTCTAVIGLRNDLVETLETLKRRAIARTPEDAENISIGYNIMISKIGDTNCP